MCKLKHYGNCDPGTKDQEYCIFHKPNKNEEEAREFWRKFLQRFKPKKEKIFIEEVQKEIERFVFEDVVDCKGFVFPEIPININHSFKYAIFNKDIDFSNTVFECNAEFNMAIFRGHTDFRGATFKQNANFYRVMFESACFNEATFKEDAIFNDSIFKKFAKFMNAIFEKNAKFTRCNFTNGEFRSAVFRGNVCFDFAKFKRADFTYAKFKGRDNWFNSTEFSQAYFGEAEFDKYAWFTSTKFGYAWFGLTKFGEYTDFSEAVFTNTVEFVDTLFRGYVEFKGTEFRGYTTFEEAEFLGKVTFKEEKDQQRIYAKFFGKLSFLNTTFEKGVNIDLPPECFKHPQAEAEACRVQRLSYEKEGNKYKADEMFLRERRALRKVKVKQAKEQLNKSNGVKSKLKALINLSKAYTSASIEFILADLTCGYGTNWIKPIALWIFTVLILCPLLYLVTNSIPNAYDFLSCLYFSIVTATTLGYGDLHPVGIGRALASAEAIFGTFMWAVFLAVFARKYMR